jgi:hypothetical protein
VNLSNHYHYAVQQWIRYRHLLDINVEGIINTNKKQISLEDMRGL